MKSKLWETGRESSGRKIHYVLFSCNAWKERSTMNLLGVTDSFDVLCVMAGSCIRSGDMLYMHNNARESWLRFQEDYHCGEVDLSMLKYGYVEMYEEYDVTSRAFASEFPRAVSTWLSLEGMAG